MTSSDSQRNSKQRESKQVKYGDDLRRVEPYKRSTKAKQSWRDLYDQ